MTPSGYQHLAIPCGVAETLRDYRDNHGLPSYGAALAHLLSCAGYDVPLTEPSFRRFQWPFKRLQSAGETLTLTEDEIMAGGGYVRAHNAARAAARRGDYRLRIGGVYVKDGRRMQDFHRVT